MYHVPSETRCHAASICIPLLSTPPGGRDIHINEFQNLLFQSNLDLSILILQIDIIFLSTFDDPLFNDHHAVVIARDDANDFSGERSFSHFPTSKEFLSTNAAEKGHCFARCETGIKFFV